jgi:hypothetical protein
LIKIETKGHNKFLEELVWIFRLGEKNREEKIKKGHWTPIAPLICTCALVTLRGWRVAPNAIMNGWI